MVVMLKHCCCGCTLKTGALIIAVVFAILAALQVVVYSVAAAEASERLEHMASLWEAQQHERLAAVVAPQADQQGRPRPADHRAARGEGEGRYAGAVPLGARVTLTHIWKWCTILLSITETISFFLNILLMFAANKDSPRHVLVWLVGFLVTSSGRLLLQLIMAGTIFYVNSVGGSLIILAILSLLALGAAYSLVVVHSYYRQLVGTGIARRISRQDE